MRGIDVSGCLALMVAGSLPVAEPLEIRVG